MLSIIKNSKTNIIGIMQNNPDNKKPQHPVGVFRIPFLVRHPVVPHIPCVRT